MRSRRQGYRLVLMAAASAEVLILSSPLAMAQEGGQATSIPATASESGAVEQAAKTPLSARDDVIIVTATRRETSLDETPQAISALSGDDQFLRGQTRMQDLQTSVPNLTFAATNNNSQYFIRGIGTSFLGAGGDPGVAVYQDGAYVSDQTTSNTSFFDLERIEVLRGPQGALYGRNAVGGAIIMLSKSPTSTFEGSISATAGNFGRAETEGYISGPTGVAETDFRVSYQLKHRNGYVSNTAPASAGGPKDFNDLDSQAIRFQTSTSLSGGGTLRLLLSHYKQSDHGDALAVVPTPGFVYPVELLAGVAPGSDPRATEANSGLFEVRADTVNVNYDQPIGDATLTLTGNYRDSRQVFENDCDGTRIDLCNFDRTTSGSDYFVDGHLASGGDEQLSWVIGATYGRFEQNQNNLISSSFPLSYLAPGAPSNIPFFFNVVSGGTVTTESSAIYADLTYKLTDVFSLTGQARYAETRRDAIETSIIPQFGINVPAFPNELHNSFLPFKLGIQAQLTPDSLLYLSYATANKDGAINLGSLQTSPVKPEEAKSIEAGFKTSFMDGSVRVNGSIFSSKYEDLQIQQVLTSVTVLSNVPKSSIVGAELDIAVSPIEGLELGLSAGYLDATIDEFSNSPNIPGVVPGPLQNLAGNKLPYISPFSITPRVSYSFDPVENYSLTVGADYSARGRTYFNEFNDPNNSQRAVSTLNLSASFQPSDESWRAFFYMNNATDRTIVTGSTIYAGTLGASRAVSYAAPRNWGAGISYSF